jgi:succinate dehydrogenase / fumarate reductase cytochrome b subunit
VHVRSLGRWAGEHRRPGTVVDKREKSSDPIAFLSHLTTWKVVAMKKALSFLETTIGKKVVMALSGLVLFGFVIAHMLGNLQVLMGPEVFNAYAIGMHSLPAPIFWGGRAVILIAFVLHVTMALQLVTRTAAARPVPYTKKKNERTTYAALTMKMSGLTLLFFVLYHLAHFTFPGVAMGAYEHLGYTQVYSNFVNGFSIPWVTALYVAAMISLGFHLYHGSFSLFQTLGLVHPKRNHIIKGAAQIVALTVTTGNIILPLSVTFGLVS